VGLAMSQRLMEEIHATEKHYMEAWSHQNKRGVASCYTTDAQIMASEMDVIKGRNGMHLFINRSGYMLRSGCRMLNRTQTVYIDMH